jgi:hypothetical protein
LQINEAVVHHDQLLLVPNVADRKRLVLQLLQRNNVTLRYGNPFARREMHSSNAAQEDSLCAGLAWQGGSEAVVGLHGGFGT